MSWLDTFAWMLAIVVAIPLLVLAVECLVASLYAQRAPVHNPVARVGCVVLIPAHDEESELGRTLTALAPELGPDDRVHVVADNCTDRTADIARAHMVEVIERADPARRGKGYALAFGIDALRAAPPAVVVILDADCVMSPGSLGRLVERATARQRPVQAAYRMTAPIAAGGDRRVAELAFLIKNVVRPLGLHRLGCPCLLTGTGMAFPWGILNGAQLGHGHIVEDMQLAVDLTAAGHLPLFAPDAEVYAEFPIENRAAGSQRKRWEHGHLKVLFVGVPRLLATSILRLRFGSLALALELGVPPLSALAIVALVSLAVLSGWAFAGGTSVPAFVLGVAIAIASLGMSSAWLRFGRTILTPAALLRIPLYVLRKVPLYVGFLIRPQASWNRTQRDNPQSSTRGQVTVCRRFGSTNLSDSQADFRPR